MSKSDFQCNPRILRTLNRTNERSCVGKAAAAAAPVKLGNGCGCLQSGRRWQRWQRPARPHRMALTDGRGRTTHHGPRAGGRGRPTTCGLLSLSGRRVCCYVTECSSVVHESSFVDHSMRRLGFRSPSAYCQVPTSFLSLWLYYGYDQKLDKPAMAEEMGVRISGKQP